MNRLKENWDYTDTTHQRYYVTGVETPVVLSSVGRRGTNAVGATTVSGYGAYLIECSGIGAVVGAAVHFYTVSGEGKIFGFGDPTASGMETLYVKAERDGSVAAYRYPDEIVARSAPGVLVFSAASYVYIEAKVTLHPYAGTVEVRIGSDPVMYLSSGVTYSNGSQQPTLIWIYPQTARRYDDMYVNDLSGDVNNDFNGDTRIDAHFMAADGPSSEWNRSAGTEQYTQIDERIPNEDSDYNFTTTSGAQDLMTAQTLIPRLIGVQSVSVLTRARRVQNAAANIAAAYRYAGSDAHAGDQQHVLTSGFTYKEAIWDYEPTTPSGAWSDDKFTAGYFGYRRTV